MEQKAPSVAVNIGTGLNFSDKDSGFVLQTVR